MARAERSGSGSGALPEAALDLHEGISASAPERWPDPAAGGCGRWPEHLRLLSSQGEAVRGRCRATNLCAYCARLAAVENAELLALDALAGNAPQVWAVLTTPLATLDTARFYRSRSELLRTLRRDWPAVEYAALVEFTTGYGPRSGGQRRPHWNLLLKGIPAEDVDAAAAVIRREWCRREGAAPEAQHVGRIGEFGGLMRYIALHFQKESQAPPEGWRGHRFLKSRGYLATSTPEARDAARASLRHKRELWRAIRRGLSAHDAELAAAEAIALAEATTWRLASLDLTMEAPPAQPADEGAQRPVSVALPAVTALAPPWRRSGSATAARRQLRLDPLDAGVPPESGLPFVPSGGRVSRAEQAPPKSPRAAPS